ncbi:MAG: asparagine--tRNA ligase [Candidatus Bathyarchaeota archaeon]|nr:asparagine--tRNA ligase [Candidatus Bathyarchaeum sp.]
MFYTDNLQDQRKRAVLKVRAKVLNSARSWFNDQGFTEVQGPTIIPATGEWSGYFEVKYFEKKAFLAQGLQPYADVFVAHLGKIYTIAPAFRAEKVRTNRHLTEYWRIEAVTPQCDLNEMIRIQEELLTHICHSLASDSIEELTHLHRHAKDLKKIEAPFPKVTYDEAIEMLQKENTNVFWGKPLSRELEKKISLQFDQPFFVTDFPVSAETFFYKSNTKRPELTLSAELLAPEGYGEIAGGGQMITEKEVLLKKMAEENIDTADQRWYLNLRRLGSVPQSGFMIGLERFIQWLCNLEHIKDTLVFPRLPDNIYP